MSRQVLDQTLLSLYEEIFQMSKEGEEALSSSDLALSLMEGREDVCDESLFYEKPSFSEYLFNLSHLLLLALHPSKQEIARAKWKEVIRFSFWESLQLPRALESLIASLLNISFETFNLIAFPSGALPLEGEGYLPEEGHIEPKKSGELALLSIVLGIKNNEPTLIEKGIAYADWQRQTFASDLPFYSLWSKEKENSRWDILAVNIALYTLVGAITKEEAFTQIAKVQLEELRKGWAYKKFTSLPLIPFLATFMVDALSLPQKERVLLKEDETFALYEGEKVRAISTLTGWNTGMGAFYKDKVRLENFGPQILPLYQGERFGIDRLARKSTLIEKNKEGFSLKGWLRAMGNSPLWMEVGTKLIDEELKIDLSFRRAHQREDLFFTFWVTGDTLLIGNDLSLNKGGFDRYRGKALPITGQKGEESLQICPFQEGNLEVIPLEGGNYFWGSSFLVAFSLPPEVKAFSWVVN